MMQSFKKYGSCSHRKMLAYRKDHGSLEMRSIDVTENTCNTK